MSIKFFAPKNLASQRLINWFFPLCLVFALCGCDAIEIDESKSPAPPAGTQEANLKILNQKTQDPGELTFLLFSANVQNIHGAPVFKTLGSIPANQSKNFKVPVGIFKIGYRDVTGDLLQMPTSDDDLIGQGSWYRVEFLSDGDYTLSITTDGNRTVWVSDLKILR